MARRVPVVTISGGGGGHRRDGDRHVERRRGLRGQHVNLNGGSATGYTSPPTITIAPPTLAGQVVVNTTSPTFAASNILPYAIVTGPSGSVDIASNVGISAGSIGAFTGYTTSLAAAETVSQNLVAAAVAAEAEARTA